MGCRHLTTLRNASLLTNHSFALSPVQMEYWVRTPECKEAKANHMDYIDRVAYSREQVRPPAKHLKVPLDAERQRPIREAERTPSE